LCFHYSQHLVLPLQSCDDDDDDDITRATGIAIADFHEVGVIFYLYDSGERSLISSVANQTFEVKWGCQSTVVTGVNEIEIGNGGQNTLDI
jgi:hypothetical protein